MKGGDVILSAETGTGKTYTYLLPIMHHLLEAENEPYVSHTHTTHTTPTRDTETPHNTLENAEGGARMMKLMV